jgi:endoglucanase
MNRFALLAARILSGVALSSTALSGTAYANAPAANAPAVQGTAQFASLPVGTCINMGNMLEPETEGAWGGKRIEDADFERIKSAGFQTIRLPVRWYNKTSEAAPYTLDDAFLNRVVAVVDMALAHDLNVILDSHNFLPLHKDPAGNSQKLAAIWNQISIKFADYPDDKLWFELENEPHNKLTNKNLIETFTPAIAAVRLTSPERPIIIGGQNWSGVNSLETLELPDDPNIYPTFHFYDPFAFTHQGADWVDDTPPVGREFGSTADKVELKRAVAKVGAYIQRTGRIPFMGETGAYEKHIPLDQRISYHRAVRQAFAPAKVGICVWAYANTYPFWDLETQDWKPGLRAAIGLSEAGATQEAQAEVQPNLTNPDIPEPLRKLDAILTGALVNDPRRLDWDSYGENAKKSVKTGDKIPGANAALSFDVKRAAEPYSAGTNVPLISDIKKGDLITVGFYARAIGAETDDGKGRLSVRFQRNSAPYPGFGDTVIKPTEKWGFYEVSAFADSDLSKKLGIVSMQYGGAVQTIEIGQTIIVTGDDKILTR